MKASINAAKAVSRILRSSLGPKGMDKMLQSPDGDVTISEWGIAAGEDSSPFVGHGDHKEPQFTYLWGLVLCS